MKKKVFNFALSGLLNWTVEAGLFNILYLILDVPSPISKFIGAVVATFTSYLSLRYWVFKNERAKDPSREFPLFIAVNLLAALLMSGIVFFGTLIIPERDIIVENLIANVFAVGAAAIFRFLCYTKYVFKSTASSSTTTT